MSEYVNDAVEAGLLSPPPDAPPDAGNLEEMCIFRFVSPIILLVSSLALSLQSDRITDMSNVLSSILSAFLLCALE